MVTKTKQETPTDKQIPVIISEIQTAADTLANLGPAVSIFGSARTSRDSPWYQRCELIAASLARAGFAVIAGGGPGMMEAANKGAHDAGGISVGLNIILPHESANNTFQTVSLSFEQFYSRKATFFMHSFAYIAMPGGFGTLDELFEALTLIQTGKIPPAPIILVGKTFWTGMTDWMKEQLLGNGMIASYDLNLYLVEDDPETVVRAVVDFHEKHLLQEQHEPTLPA